MAERGVIAGCAMLAVTAALFWRLAPAPVKTPGRIVATGIAKAHDRVWQTRNAGEEGAMPGTVSIVPSPLRDLILAAGGRCDRIVRVEPLRIGDGLFEILCREGDGHALRYRVDTRLGGVGALSA